MAALTFTWLLSSEYRPCLKNWLKSSWSSCLHVGGSPLNLKHSAYCWWECSGRVCSDHTVFQLVPVSNSSYKQWAPLLLHLAAWNLEVRGVSDCVIRHILSIYIYIGCIPNPTFFIWPYSSNVTFNVYIYMWLCPELSNVIFNVMVLFRSNVTFRQLCSVQSNSQCDGSVQKSCNLQCDNSVQKSYTLQCDGSVIKSCNLQCDGSVQK